MERDYYKILAVGRDADELTLKSAYRKLAVQYHPDRNPGSREAEERFKEAAEAYSVLIDPVQRAAYDRRTAAPRATVRPSGSRRVRITPYATAAVSALLVLVVLFGAGRILSRNTTQAQTLQAGSAFAVPAIEPPQPEPAPQSVPKKRVRRPSGTVTLIRGARPVTMTELDYAPDALREGVDGLVEVQFTVAEDGSVQSPRIVTGHPLLTQGLPEALSRWTFRPMRVNGRPVPMPTEMTLRFSIVQ